MNKKKKITIEIKICEYRYYVTSKTEKIFFFNFVSTELNI